MNYKKEAEALVERFRDATSYKYQEYAGAKYSTFEHEPEQLKQCAIIYCVGMIAEIKNTTFIFDSGQIIRIDHYRKILNHLEK